MSARKSSVSLLANLVLLAVIAAVEAGCTATAPRGEWTSRDWIRFKSSERALEQAKTAQIDCPNESLCHPSVALLTAVNGPFASMCSAFMIGDDIVATNSHCIPDDLKGADADCLDRIWVVFPAMAGKQFERFRCNRMISASSLESNLTANGKFKEAPDYAFLKLEQKPERTPFKIGSEGFPEGASTTIVKVDPSREKLPVLLGHLTSSQCKVVQRTIYLPSFNHPQRANVTLSDCEVIHGNSGSPIISSKSDKVVGIIQAFYDTAQLIENDPKYNPAKTLNSKAKTPYDKLEDWHSTTMHLGTNLACVKVPNQSESGLSDPAICQANHDYTELDLLKDSEAAFDAQVKQAMDKWLAQDSTPAINRHFSWQPNWLHEKKGGAIELKPDCILKLENSPLEVKTNADLTITSPILKYRQGYNRYLQLIKELVGENISTASTSKSSPQKQWQLRLKANHDPTESAAGPGASLTVDQCETPSAGENP